MQTIYELGFEALSLMFRCGGYNRANDTVRRPAASSPAHCSVVEIHFNLEGLSPLLRDAGSDAGCIARRGAGGKKLKSNDRSARCHGLTFNLPR